VAKGAEILRGVPGAPGVVVATVRVVDKDKTKMAKVLPGEVLVGVRFVPEHIEYEKKASALITDLGGILSHTAITGKTYHIPTVVGTMEATSKLTDGQMVVVDGNEGAIYEYLPEAEVAPLAERLAALAAKKGVKLDPSLLAKIKKAGL